METNSKFLTPPFVITLVLLGMVGFVIYVAFYGTPPASVEVQIMIITAVVINGLPEIRKFWMSSTADSADKNQTIAQQADTTAKAQAALLDPAVIVTVDPSKRVAAAAPGAALKADVVQVVGENVEVVEQPVKP